MADTTFQIELGVAGAAGVDSAANSIQALEERLTGATSAASQAADAVKAGEAAYKAQEAAADRASKALEKINVAMQSASGAKLENLTARQVEAAQAADKAKLALQGEAAALDQLKVSATQAAKAQVSINNQLEAQKKAADAAAKASAASKGTGNLGKLSGALNQLGGPLGKISGQATGAADAISDLTETVGAAGPYVALAVAVVAVSAAFLAATIAATKWAISMADAARGTKELEKREERLKKLTTSLFAGPKVQGAFDKFLGGLDSLIDLFDDTNASGKAMRVVFDDLFGGLIDGAAELVPKIRSAFIQMEIWILKALIAIKPFGSTILKVGEALLIAGAIVVGVVVAALVLLVGAIVGALLILYQFGKIIYDGVASLMALGTAIYNGVGAALEWLKGKFTEALAFLSSISLVEIGTNLIAGLASGITSGAAAVVGAITGVVGGAIDAAKGLLGIASPSKVFADIGMNTGEGFTGGVEDTTSTAQGALETMVAPPDASAVAGPVATSKSGTSTNLSGATFNFYGVEGAEDAEARFGALLTRLLEGDASQLGSGVAGA